MLFPKRQIIGTAISQIRPIDMPRSITNFSYLTFIVLGLGILLRVLYLDADPHYYEWIGYITDEGRWLYHARDIFLFQSSSRDRTYDLHLILAPFFQLTNYFIFDLIGFNRLSSRIFTALCGSALLLLFWRKLRHTVTPQALFVGVTLLAVQVDFVVLSRLAVPEMAVVFLQALVYFVLVSHTSSPRQMLLAGFLLLLAVGMKGTVAPSLGIFSAMILFMPRADRESAGRSRRWQELLWFWVGFITPLLLLSVIWLGCCLREWPVAFGESSGANYLSTLIGFIHFSDLYKIFAFPFKNPLAPNLNFLALGLWLSWLGWTASGSDEVDAPSRRYLVTSTVWIIAYLSLMLALEYFPERYMVHVVLPMVINITVGISLLQRLGMHKVLVSSQRSGRAQFLRLSVLGLPTAVFVAPLLAYAIALTGADPEPLRIQLACVIFSTAVTTYIVRQVKAYERALGFFILFPVVEAVVWLALSLPGLTEVSLWPKKDSEMSRMLFMGSLAVAAMTTSIVIFRGRGGFTAASRLCTIYVIGYLTTSLIRLAPGYFDPHYTIRDISRDLGASLNGASSIATDRGDGLFNDNSLRYRRFEFETWTSERPEILVTVFDFYGDREILQKRYHLIKTYLSYVSPEYYEIHPSSSLPEIKVYKRNDD